MRKVGNRIGAVLSANKETVELLGYGMENEVRKMVGNRKIVIAAIENKPA